MEFSNIDLQIPCTQSLALPSSMMARDSQPPNWGAFHWGLAITTVQSVYCDNEENWNRMPKKDSVKKKEKREEKNESHHSFCANKEKENTYLSLQS